MTKDPEILVVDDEPDLRALVVDYLTLHGFALREAESAAALDRRLAERRADLVILDVNMPGESGTTALVRLRAAGFTGGVILLTAADDIPDRLSGLHAGADDYVTKPFAPRELLARVRAVLRRLPPEAAAPPAPAFVSRRIVMGRATLDLDARRLIAADGTELALTAMEFDLLAVFARHARQTLSRDRLAELAHGRRLEPRDRSIDIRILRLRQKLEADPANPRIIRTAWGEGYVFDPAG